MPDETITIKIVTEWNAEEIIALYTAAGWWQEAYDSKKLPQLIKGSFAFAIAYDEQLSKAIGMGRVLSDGISDGYIQDVVVLPSYRGKGIGKKIIQTLIDYCLSKEVTWIALISEPGFSSFYKPLGFQEMKDYTPMKYKM